MRQKSITTNMVLNMVKGAMGVVFPLITFPYITRVLGVDAIGQYNFAASIVSYFVLIAGLGISNYAIRNGAGYRENALELETFVSQILTINILTTLLSYFLLLILVAYVDVMDSRAVILALSLQIVFKTIGVEWLYSVFEDYLFITTRSIAFQVLSLILMFALVRSQNDILWYATITVISSAGTGIVGFFHARKYCKLHLTRHPNIKKHLKPILLFFATNLTVMIYVNSDTTILGAVSGNYAVGIYSVSVKVYTLVKSILASAIVVSIPRMSALWKNKDEVAFQSLGAEIYDIFLTLVIPAIIGIILLNKEIIMLIAGPDFLDANFSLIILSVALFFCLGAGFWSQGVMIPQNRENDVFKITAVSAIANIILNFILIPLFQERAAALTTVIAEAIVFFYCRSASTKSLDFGSKKDILLKILAGCIPMILINLAVKCLISTQWIIAVLTVGLCVPLYFSIEYILGNTAVVKYKKEIMAKLQR